MAKVTAKLPDDLLKKLSKLGSRTDDITEKMLKAGGEVVLKATKSRLQDVIGKDLKSKSRSTSELVNSLGLARPLLDKNGNYNVKVGFSEPRSDGDSNAKIANILEYGKHGQPAKPFFAPAARSSKKDCIAAMTRTFDEEVKKI